MSDRQNDLAAIVRLLDYARREVERLDLADCARLIELPLAALSQQMEIGRRSSVLAELKLAAERPTGTTH